MRKWKDVPTVQGGRRMFLKLLTAAGVVGGLGLIPKPAAAQTTPGAAGSPRTSPAFTYRRLSKDEVAHRPIEPGKWLELRVPVRVRQEPDVEHEIRFERDAVLEAERDDVDPQVVGRREARDDGEDPILELADREPARVDHVVGKAPRPRQPAALLGDARLHAAA